MTESAARPDLFIVGAPKCGTTTMSTFLAQHPQVAMCTVKDLHYFGADIQESIAPARGLAEINEAEYLSFFPPAKGAVRAGETSVWYLYSRDAAREIARFEPGARIVAMLRDPVEMIHSLHSQRVYTGGEPERDFTTALALDGARERGERSPPRGAPVRSYRAAVRYAEQLKRYFDAFGRQRVHVILFDDFRDRTLEEYSRLCRFLDVADDFEPDLTVVNSNKRARSALMGKLVRYPPRPLRRMVRTLTTRSMRSSAVARLHRLNTRFEPREPMPVALRELLAAELMDEVQELSDLLDRDLGRWLAPAHTV